MIDASASIVELREEAVKQEIMLALAERQAQLAQELAIAKRIENAIEVEIEEYYDNSGKNTAGLNINTETQTGSLGLSSEHKMITKRIYRFKGTASFGVEETYEQDLSDKNKK